jgi:hypothetical protein
VPCLATSTLGVLAAPEGSLLAAASLFPGRPAPAFAPESPRAQRLKQLAFDRRPSTVLKAWARKPDAAEGDDKGPKDPLEAELAGFQHNVTLGDWAAVKAYLAGLPTAEGRAAYLHLLQALQTGPVGPMPVQGPGMPPMPQQFWEQNTFNADDLVGLAAAAPKGLDREALTGLGGVLRRALASGTVVEAVVARFGAETSRPAGRAALTRREAARILTSGGEAAVTEPFLPTPRQAREDGDPEGLNLLALHYLALYDRDKKAALLEQAWEVTQEALALTGGKPEDKEEALHRAVELAPRIKDTLGQAWLEQSFTTHPDRGMEILAAVGGLVSQGLQSRPMNPDERLKELQLQKTAVDALLKAAPGRAEKWRSTLALLAGAWLHEADYSRQYDHSTGLGPHMRRDPFGNLFFVNDDDPMQAMLMRQQNLPQALRTADVLRNRPGERWVERLDEGLRARLATVLAQLYLKAGEEERAFPHIERLAATHPRRARELVNEFLRVWTQNHDPNAARRNTNPYMFFFGFEQRANGIPLTRSKQERNLTELAGWVARIRKLPIPEPDQELLAKAFTNCHSTAEVYRLDAIEKVFGSLGNIKPRTLAGLAQQMRENLAGLWREPANQEDKKTNRKQKDIQAEVLRGYALAGTVIDNALARYPDDWSLTLARAALLFDETNYRQELSKDTSFSKKRTEALEGFRKAAALYAAHVKGLTEEEQSTQVYEQWFYASLGACDLGQVTDEKLPDLKQPPLIRAALSALPGEAARWHMDRFANLLFTRMSGVKPAAKFRYVRSGMAIVGDNKQAEEARKVFDYYKDLVRELKLEVVLDGPGRVGHREPFGVLVRLRHTREIERESGGFGRYLQNQNNMIFAFNYGRPTADYRDKFQAAATEALKENFEVLSVTFETDKVHSRAAAEYGWRYTPYAYLLLRPRGPQVDKVPPLRMDLDFLDTSGYVVLPIESEAVPVDARPERGDPRPVSKLQLTQILDERQAAQGKLGLEVRATARGLVGPLDRVLELKPEGFEVERVDDKGVSVAKFDEDAEDVAVVSERTWLVALRARPGEVPTSFRFARALPERAEVVYQRYQDADLVGAQPEVPLEGAYGGSGHRWVLVAAGAGLALVIAAALLVWLRRRLRGPAAARVALPQRLTPFTVLVLLRHVLAAGSLDGAARAELERAIADLERRYFAEEEAGAADVELRSLAERWALRLGGQGV